MKKWLVRLVLAVVILLVVVVVAVGLFLSSGIKRGVETFGPELTKVSIKLDSVALSLLSGGGKIKGLEVGNPEGYAAPTSIKLGSASVSLQPSSLLADKIVIKSIVVEAPEINIEGTPTKNNLTKILNNVEAATGGGKDVTATTTSGKPAKKLQVDEFVLTGVKVNYTVPGLGTTVPIALPEIKLTNLGAGPEGITAGDLTDKVLSKVMNELTPLLVEQVSKHLGTAGEGAGKVVGEASKTLKGVTDIFKKK